MYLNVLYRQNQVEVLKFPRETRLREKKPGRFIMGEMEWQVASPLAQCCVLWCLAAPPLAHPSAPLLAPVMPHQAREPQSGAQTSKTPA